MDPRTIALRERRFQDFLERKIPNYPCIPYAQTDEYNEFRKICTEAELSFETKMMQYDSKDKYHIFCALMRIIKDQGQFTRHSILSAWMRLNYLIEKKSKDLDMYFYEPINQISVTTINGRLRYKCLFEFETKLFEDYYCTNRAWVIYFPEYNRVDIFF